MAGLNKAKIGIMALIHKKLTSFWLTFESSYNNTHCSTLWLSDNPKPCITFTVSRKNSCHCVVFFLNSTPISLVALKVYGDVQASHIVHFKSIPLANHCLIGECLFFLKNNTEKNSIFVMLYFTYLIQFLHFQRSHDIKDQPLHQTDMAYCQVTDGMEWTDLTALRDRSLPNRLSKEQYLSRNTSGAQRTCELIRTALYTGTELAGQMINRILHL